jgi:hypothetical protein
MPGSRDLVQLRAALSMHREQQRRGKYPSEPRKRAEAYAKERCQPQASVVEDAPQRLLLVEGVAERGGDEAGRARTGVLELRPGEERVDQRTDDRVAAHLAFQGWEIRERAIGGEEGVDATQPLDAEFVLADRRLPEVGAAVRPTSDFGRGRTAVVVSGSASLGRAAEEGVIDGVCVGLNVSREAAEHLAHCSARVLGLVLEEDMILVREDDEEVSSAARSRLLGLALQDGPRLDRDPDGVRGEAARRLECLFPRGLDDGAQGRACVFGVTAHRAAIERRALKLQLLLESIEGDTKQVLARVYRGKGMIKLHRGGMATQIGLFCWGFQQEGAGDMHLPSV